MKKRLITQRQEYKRCYCIGVIVKIQKASLGNDTYTIKYNLNNNMIYKMSLLYLKVPMDCEDAMQEVIIKLLQRGNDFKIKNMKKDGY